MVPDEKERWWSVDSAYITTDKTALKFNVPVSTARTHSFLSFILLKMVKDWEVLKQAHRT